MSDYDMEEDEDDGDEAPDAGGDGGNVATETTDESVDNLLRESSQVDGSCFSKIESIKLLYL